MSREFRDAAWDYHLDKKYQKGISDRAAGDHKLLEAAKLNKWTFEKRHPNMLNHRPNVPVRGLLNGHIGNARMIANISSEDSSDAAKMSERTFKNLPSKAPKRRHSSHHKHKQPNGHRRTNSLR